jgi:peptide/nickel transport system substrate-binding protein
LTGAPGVRLVRSADTSFTYLGFHLEAPPFDDPRVRRAVAHAIDRKALVRDVLGGHGTVADGPFAPGDPWHHPDVTRYDHDPDRARALLAEAGRPVRFTIRTVAGDRVKEAAAARIVADLRAVGVSAEVRTHPMAELLREHVAPRRFEAILLALVPGTDPDFLLSFYHSQMMTPHGWNRFAYRDPAVDRMLEQSRSEIDARTRRALIGGALEKITADAPQVFLFHPEVVDAARDDIILPALPRRAANRFMYLHEWFRRPACGRPPR